MPCSCFRVFPAPAPAILLLQIRGGLQIGHLISGVAGFSEMRGQFGIGMGGPFRSESVVHLKWNTLKGLSMLHSGVLPRQALVRPEEAPVSILEQLAGIPLTWRS